MINRDKIYWVRNFNIAGVVYQFYLKCNSRLNKQLTNHKINMIIYDRKDINYIKEKINIKYFLEGWLPYGEYQEYHDYDFIITLNSVIPKETIIEKLTPIRHKVLLFQTVVLKRKGSEMVDVLLEYFWD